MIEVGNRVKWSDIPDKGTVIRLDDSEFSVRWDTAPDGPALSYPYSVLVKRPRDLNYIQIIPADPAPAPVTTDHSMTLAGWYAAQVGTMEVRLADIYFVTKRAQEAVAKSNASGLNWQLDHIIEAIERTADKLASLTSPSSSDDAGWLQSRIYANRK